MDDTASNTRQKALMLNLEATTYGTFAEIGAGQEVARWFFSVCGAAGTVAKSISAYDMEVSRGFYGTWPGSGTGTRLEAMLDQEFAQLGKRRTIRRGESKKFFVFAVTAAIRSYCKP